MKIVTIDFDAQGNPIIETSGFEGSTCKTETADLEHVLGGHPTAFTRKPEFYRTTTAVQQKQKAGR